MDTVNFAELDDLQKRLLSGKAVIRIESWMTDEQIGKHIRHYVEKAQGAPVTVQYDVITDDMMRALRNSSSN